MKKQNSSRLKIVNFIILLSFLFTTVFFPMGVYAVTETATVLNMVNCPTGSNTSKFNIQFDKRLDVGQVEASGNISVTNYIKINGKILSEFVLAYPGSIQIYLGCNTDKGLFEIYIDNDKIAQADKLKNGTSGASADIIEILPGLTAPSGVQTIKSQTFKRISETGFALIGSPLTSIVIDKTGFSTVYTQNFNEITNDLVGLAKLNEFWAVQDDTKFGQTVVAVPASEGVPAVDAANGMIITDTALRFKWIQGRSIYSNAILGKSIVSFDAKIQGPNDGLTNDGRQVFAIRQISNNGVYQNENDKSWYAEGVATQIPGVHCGVEGIIFELNTDGITVVVDDTTVPSSINKKADGITDKAEEDKVTSWNINSKILFPEGISFDGFNKVIVVDKGTLIQLVVGDKLLATIELSNLVDGVYKTATIKDTDGVVLISTQTANVPEKGKIGFGVRSWTMDIDNIEIMSDSRDIISFNLSANQPIELVNNGKIGQTFTTTEQFNTLSLSMCTWNTAKAGYTFQLRKVGPFGQIVFRHAYSNAVDGSNPIYIVGNFPAGNYYLEINTLVLGTEVDNTKVSQVGLWASQNKVDAYAGGTAYLDGSAMNFDLDFKVKAIGINAETLDNEYVYSPQVTFTLTQSNVTAFDGSNGKITVMAQGGSGADEYSKDNGVSWQNSNVFYPLEAGTYQIKTRDKVDPSNITDATWVNITKPAIVTITFSQSAVTTYNGNDASLTINASGGNGTYEYSNDNGLTWQASNTFSSLSATTYRIKVRDKADTDNITTTMAISISQPAQVTITLSQTNVTTYTENDGSITITPLGGKGTFQYSNDNGSTWQDTNIFASLSAATYQIKVRDKVDIANITAAMQVTITKPAPQVTLIFSQSNVTTNAGNDGKITITASGGEGIYQYSKDNGSTWQDSNTFSSLSASTYQIAARDKVETANITSVTQVTITQPTPQVTLTFLQTNVTTYTGNDGSITITAAGGKGTYQFSKDNGSTWQSSNTFVSLSVAAYQIIARDNAETANITAPTAVIITQPAQVTLTFSQSNATTYAGNDGSITINASGGKGTYQFSKDNGSTWQDLNTFTSLSVATYQIKVRDKSDIVNTSTSSPATITQPAQPIPTTPITNTITQNNVTTNGSSDGKITVNASGGSGSFEFSKDNGQTWQSSNMFNGLQAGTYTIQVRDKFATENVTTLPQITITAPAIVNPNTSDNLNLQIALVGIILSSSVIVTAKKKKKVRV